MGALGGPLEAILSDLKVSQAAFKPLYFETPKFHSRLDGSVIFGPRRGSSWASRRLPGASWGLLGGVRGPLGRLLGGLGASWGLPGVPLGCLGGWPGAWPGGGGAGLGFGRGPGRLAGGVPLGVGEIDPATREFGPSKFWAQPPPGRAYKQAYMLSIYASLYTKT